MPDYRFSGFSFNTDSLELKGETGRVALEPQVFQLLQFLIENRDRVVSKDEIIDAVWDGRIVSDTALNTRISAVRRALGDDGKTQAIIKTFPRRGFRFVAQLSGNRTPDKINQPLSLPDKPSIAVLPFDNLSDDPEQEYFSDGITEDVITALSRIRQFVVIARNTTFSYRGQAVEVPSVAKDLGVRYILKGSVRKAGIRVRISAQLIDSESGKQIWAERYDRDLEDVFDLQDEMTENIVGAIEPAITKSEIQRSNFNRPDSLDAWDLCQRGWWHRYRIRREDFIEARRCFESALEVDPDFVSALAGLSDVLSYEVLFSFSDDPEANAGEAIKFARRAIEIDDEDPIAHLSLGRAYLVAEQFENSTYALQKALDLNPYSAAAYYALGHVYIVIGHLHEGIDAVRKAIALSPRDIWMGPFYARLAQAYLALKDYEKAKVNAEEAFRYPAPPNWPGKSYLVSALGHLEFRTQARTALDELLQLKPELTIGWIRSHGLAANMGRDFMDDYLDGLRKAGLPE